MKNIVAKANRPAYLANVLCIAKVGGGDVAASESLVLRSIIHGIGGTRDDIRAAAAMLADGQYQLQVPETPREQLANLQDMIMVALADGRLSPMESAPIETMAKAIGYTQVDMDHAVKRAKLALRRIGRTPSDFKVESKPPPPPPPPKAGRYVIEPPPVPPPVPQVEHAPPPKATLPEAEEEPPTEEQSPEAIEEVSSAEVSETEEAVASVNEPPRDQISHSVSPAVEACARCRAESENPDEYCFGIPDGPISPLGCRLLKMPWTQGAPWLELGRYRDDATFVFDKRAIAEYLATRLTSVASCPHLDNAYVERVVECLPARAAIGPRWQYRHARSGDPDAVTVKETRYVHGCAVSTTITVRGVDPIGTRDARSIMRKAGHRPPSCGLTDGMRRGVVVAGLLGQAPRRGSANH